MNLTEEEIISENQAPVELYVGEDIIQGEKIPFYLIWSKNSVEQIILEYEGFGSLEKLYNVVEYEEKNYTVLIKKDKLKYNGYIGGAFLTSLGKSPKEYAKLKATLYYNDGEVQTLIEERNLHSTRVKIVKCPKEIELPLNKNIKPIEIKLVGAATVLIDIEKASKGIEITLRPDVILAIERFGNSVFDSLIRLKTEFPQYSNEISSLLNYKNLKSYSSYYRRAEKIFQDFKKDKNFMEAIYYSFTTAILEHESLRDSVLLPLMEYFESNATSKTFLNSPFLCVKVPIGGGRMRCRLLFYDLIGHRCNSPIIIDTLISSKEEVLIQLKEIIQFKRSLDDSE